MPSIEDSIRNGLEKTEPHREKLLTEAADCFFQAMPNEGVPSKENVDDATKSVDRFLRDGLLNKKSLELLATGPPPSDDRVASIRHGSRRFLLPIRLPPPSHTSEMSERDSALVAAFGTVVGAAVGMYTFVPLARLALGLREPMHIALLALPACFLGCVLGASGAIVLVGAVSKSPRVKKYLRVAETVRFNWQWRHFSKIIDLPAFGCFVQTS